MNKELVLCCVADEPIPSAEFPMLRFTRVGDTIDIYMNGVKINILGIDEMRWFLAGLGRLCDVCH